MDAKQEAKLLAMIDEADIRRIITTYTYAADWSRKDVMERLFWPDAALDFGVFKGDRQGFLEWSSGTAKLQRRLHSFSGERVALFGDEAQADAVCLVHNRGERPTGAYSDRLSLGRYLFKLARRDGEWRISAITIVNHFSHEWPVSDEERSRPSRSDNMSPDHRFAPRF